MTRTSRIVALQLLTICASKSYAGLRNGNVNGIKRKVGDDRKQLFRDDEGFWTRYVEEVSASISTPPPTLEPTLLPPQQDCAAAVGIECFSGDGMIDCVDLSSPDLICPAESSVVSVSFVLEFCACAESKNSEGAICSDEAELPESGEVRVSCLDSDNMLLYSQNVEEGDTLTMSGDTEIITCYLFTDIGEPLQSFEINISGSVDLYLGDKFGSLTLVTCGDTDCLAEITYNYSVCSLGEIPVTVTKFERDREGDVVDLLEDINTEVEKGDCETATETVTINLCQENSYFTTLIMEDSTLQCGAEVDYFFEISSSEPSPVACSVDVEVTCKTEEGVECNEVEPPEDCSLVEVCYEYELSNVGSNSMTITSVERTRNDDTVSLMEELETTSLAPGGSTSVVEKEMVDFCVEAEHCTDVIAGADPPNGMTCSDENMYKLNTSEPPATPEPTLAPTPTPTPTPTIDPFTETVPDTPAPTPKPDIPAPTPEPDTPEPDTPAPTSEPVPEILPPTLPETQLPTLPETPPPTPFPSASPTPDLCEFEMEIECPNCNATPPPVAQCEGRPLSMGWIYTGGGCENSWNVQGEKFICEDFNGGPPTMLGEKSFIVVTDADGDVTYHSDYVEVGSLYIHDGGGEPFSANSLITIYKNNITDDLANLLQSVQYHSSCSSTLFLKNRFGANILVQWTNEEQGTISCFANQTFIIEVGIPIDFQGGPATVTSLTVASNVDPFFFNLTSSVAGTQIDAGDVFQTTVAVPIELTEKRSYNMLVTLQAETAGGSTCIATDLVSFEAGYPLPPIFPTFSPTDSPDPV